MSGGADALLGRLDQRLGDGGRIRAAGDPVLPIGQRTQRDGVLLGRAEYGAQQLPDKVERRVIIIVNVKLDRTRIGVNILHETP